MLDLVKQVATLPTLHIKGLMTIGLFSAETEKVRACFQLLKRIQQDIIALNLPNVDPQELSMGMSGDFGNRYRGRRYYRACGYGYLRSAYLPDSYYWMRRAVRGVGVRCQVSGVSVCPVLLVCPVR